MKDQSENSRCVHGFGFASVLADLGLPKDALLLALVWFAERVWNFKVPFV